MVEMKLLAQQRDLQVLLLRTSISGRWIQHVPVCQLDKGYLIFLVVGFDADVMLK